MRVFRLLATASVFALPRAASAGLWSYFESDEAAAEDEKSGGSVPVTEQETPEPPTGADDDPLIAGFPGLVAWFRSHGGVLDDRVTIGYEAGSKIRGMIATADIPAGTLIIHAPGNVVLSTPSEDQCEKIGEVIREMQVGTQSKWHAYFEFDDSTGSRLPCEWDRSARAITELQGLPPTGDTHRHVDWYKAGCNKGRELSEMDWKALKIYLTRAADIGLIPIYDLMNHHNGKINTVLERDAGGGLKVIALNDIPANSNIYNTYARSGWESSVDVFNTYGFVEDYPQLWRWSTSELEELMQANKDHANNRYGVTNPGDVAEPGDRLHYQPNTVHYEILVLSPTLAALLPTKHLVGALGNHQQSLEEWERLVIAHHARLRSSHANAIAGSAEAILNELPTTIEEDERLLPDERRRLEKVRKVGRVDVNKADAIQAIEYRLAFKSALRLAIDVAEHGRFLVDVEEL